MHASLRRFAFLCALLMIACHAKTALAGAQADKAIAAVKELAARGEIKPGTVLKIRIKQGNMVSFLGRDYELQKDWERLTGVPIDANVMPQLDSFESIRRATDIDLTIARNHEYPDLFHEALIEELTPYMRRFGFTLADDPESGYMLHRQQAYFGDRLVAVPADMDIAFLFLRRDLLEDPLHRARFREKYGRDLGVPKTWRDYQQQVVYFTQPDKGLYGSAEPRERLTGWMFWMPRYLSAAAPNQHLFDDQMKPLIDSPAGVAATESYVATVSYSPPAILGEGNDYSYALPFFLRGNAYATLLTAATAKIAHRDTSAVKGKFMSVPMPGHAVGKRLVRRTLFIYGNNLVIPRTSPSKELAFLYAMWLTDPDNSIRSVTANGIADPYRHNHLRDERVTAMYTAQPLALLKSELAVAAPSGTGLPGDREYLAALSDNIWLAAGGRMTPKEAMAKTAREWNAITEKYGRTKQAAHWQAFKKAYPSVTEALP